MFLLKSHRVVHSLNMSATSQALALCAVLAVVHQDSVIDVVREDASSVVPETAETDFSEATRHRFHILCTVPSRGTNPLVYTALMINTAPSQPPRLSRLRTAQQDYSRVTVILNPLSRTQHILEDAHSPHAPLNIPHPITERVYLLASPNQCMPSQPGAFGAQHLYHVSNTN